MADTATPTQCLPPLLPERTRFCLGQQCAFVSRLISVMEVTVLSAWLSASQSFWAFIQWNQSSSLPAAPCSAETRAVSKQHAHLILKSCIKADSNIRRWRGKKTLGGTLSLNTASPAMGCLLPASRLPRERKVPNIVAMPWWYIDPIYLCIHTHSPSLRRERE